MSSDADFRESSAVEYIGGGREENRRGGVRVGDAHSCPKSFEEFCVEFEGGDNGELCVEWDVLAY